MTSATATIAIIAAVFVVSGYKPVPPAPRHNIVIAVNSDGDTAITVDGKRVTCPELNAVIATETPKAHPFDCKLMRAPPSEGR